LSTLLLEHNRSNRFNIGGSADGRTSADFIKTSGLVKRNDVIVRIDFRSSDDRRCVKRSDKAIDNRGHRLLRYARNDDADPV
jgi:hypothetical protein